MISIAIIILAAFGCVISVYFTLVYYNFLEAEATFIPKLCRLEKKTCSTILSTREAKIFGVPNSLLGIAWYFGLLIHFGIANLFSNFILLFVSAITVLVGVYLLFALFFRLKIPCSLCITSHAINFSIFLLLLFYS